LASPRRTWEQESSTGAPKARHRIEEVERIGAEPFQAPDLLPPIEPEEIHLITWMAIRQRPPADLDRDPLKSHRA